MIKIGNLNYTSFNFPVGEKQIKIKDSILGQNITIDFKFEHNAEIMELLLLVDALRRSKVNKINLNMLYIPYSRQDRVMVYGESFSLKVFADLINSCKFANVNVYDPHSDVSTALINNCRITEQYRIFSTLLSEKKNYVLVSPDAGALKKITKLSLILKKEIILCSKIRDINNGNITGVKIYSENLGNKDCVIVDDICDGGRTFIEIAKKLKNLTTGKIILCVTHGFFTKGLRVFYGLIDEIYTKDGQI